MNNHQFVFSENDEVLIDSIFYPLTDFYPEFRQALTTLRMYDKSRASAETIIDRRVADFTYALHKAAVEQLWTEALCPLPCRVCRTLALRESWKSQELTTSAAASKHSCPRWA
jgi:hypothetical protein